VRLLPDKVLFMIELTGRLKSERPLKS